MADRDGIDRIESVGAKKKTQWVAIHEEKSPGEKPFVPAVKPKTETDSLESLKSPVKQQKTEESSPGFWSRVWSGICGLFGYSAAAATGAGDGGSNKPGGDGVRALSGSPTLEAPQMFDLKAFTRLLKETQDALNQVKETNNEAEEELNSSEKSQQQLLQYLKAQRTMYEEGTELLKLKYIRHQEAQRAVRKKLGDAKTEAMEAASNERYWGWWNTGSKLALLASSVGLLGLSFLSGGWAAVPLLAFKIAAPVASAFHGITTLMKSSMTQQLNDKRSVVTVLSHQNSRFSQIKIPEDLAQMNQSFEQSLEIVTKHLKRQEENRSNTIKSIVLDISAR